MPAWTSKAWFLTGPTASGKSRLAIPLAEALGAEIIALDSMTLYRGMDIGTDKPTAEDRQRVRHHLIDLFSPDHSASLDQYLKLAGEAVEEIHARGKQALFVGGTPLYLKGALRGIFAGPPADVAFRQRLYDEVETKGSAHLHDMLARVDPKGAAKIQPGDARRIVRALEVYEKTGRPISEWQQEFDVPASPRPKVACLVPERDARHERINRRVEKMLGCGWIDEVRALLAPPEGLGRVARQAVGYEEIIAHLEGKLDREAMMTRIQTRTRQFSKRQMTWFRHIEECTFFPVVGDDSASLLPQLRAFFEAPLCQNDAGDSNVPLADDAVKS